MTTYGLRPRPGIVLSGLVGGAAIASGIALTATSGWLIVRASQGPQILTLLTAIVAVRAFGMARPVFRYVERVQSHDVALADLADRRVGLYGALIPLTPARLGRRARADVLSGVVDDLSEVVDAQVRVTVPLVAAGSAGGLAAILTALISPGAGLVLSALLLLIAAGGAFAWRTERAGQSEVLAARANVMAVSDLVTGRAMELAAVGGSATATRWLDTAQAKLSAVTLRQSRGRALIAGIILLGTGLAAVASAAIAAGSDLSAPLRALLVVTPVAVGDALVGITDAVRSLARAQGARDRLDDLTGQTPAVAPSAPGAPAAQHGVPELRLSGVSAEWERGRPAMGPVDLTFPAGSRTMIVGPNGSGKSTLLAVLARQLDPVDGTYTVDGADVRDLDLAGVRDLCAVVDDEPHIFASSVLENLRLAAPDATSAEIEQALLAAGLQSWLSGLRDGLDTRIGAGGIGVSGGERARIGLARALLSGRGIILLDEPVAHLDHATAVSVLKDVERTTTGRTVVMVSHRSAPLTDARIVQLNPPSSQMTKVS
ncbi:MAG: thiol reductant ABC exporter subunit CydC [Nostocoides sp.]